MKQQIRKFKHALKYLLRVFMIKIRNGPLKGEKWIAATASKFILGTYEPFKTAAYLQNLHEGDVVYDVGAHVGYYAAIAATLVGKRGQVFAFEPRPLNIIYLKRHIQVNQMSNVQVIEACVGDKSRQCRFETRTGTGTGHISEQGDITVDMVCLDELFSEGELPKPNFIKIDVEGGEVLVLEGARRVIQESQPIILVATHSDSKHKFVTDFLDSFGYKYRILDKKGGSGDTEILALPKKQTIK